MNAVTLREPAYRKQILNAWRAARPLHSKLALLAASRFFCGCPCKHGIRCKIDLLLCLSRKKIPKYMSVFRDEFFRGTTRIEAVRY